MSPWAPDHNPIEHVWNEAKNQISNLQRGTLTETTTAFEAFITGNTFFYRPKETIYFAPYVNMALYLPEK